MSDNVFGNYIKELREKNGYKSQRVFSEKIGVSNSTIAKIERGVHEASPETLAKFAEAFNMDVMTLIEKQFAGNKEGTEALLEKLNRLTKDQYKMVTNIVDEFIRLGGKF